MVWKTKRYARNHSYDDSKFFLIQKGNSRVLCVLLVLFYDSFTTRLRLFVVVVFFLTLSLFSALFFFQFFFEDGASVVGDGADAEDARG